MKKFEEVEHKNFELLRYYLSSDIGKLRKEINSNNNQILGYFIASIVDVLIVFFFEEYLINSSLLNKIVCSFGLIIIFILISKFIYMCVEMINVRIKEEGRGLILEENIQEKIDFFDNVACDGLLICENYINRYKNESKDYLKNFYYFEVIHHLKKVRDIFLFINNDREKYISSKNKELIDPYRIDNFIIFAKTINKFLQDEKIKYDKDINIKIDLNNLNSEISKWEI